ncbi:hypothetical protein KYB31_06230 [Clostridium felsineum]|uniref:cytochrome b5 domain-containing protein n=1 Tax=Clostridium felsineum TaxID=36839 RepID=UPI00214D54C7|nr:cytochrome b5 domain-containing protein [Clostridium felsineum]MCR3758593.1 hypothetical protein [Clostridium felsineum]
MKKAFKYICVFLALMSVLLCGCSSNSSTTKNNNTTTKSTAENTTKTFTVDELKKYNGKNGNPAYVAIGGIVYDVTHADKWNNGEHQEGITAGKDLTKEIERSPHGTDVLKNLPIVGKLK